MNRKTLSFVAIMAGILGVLFTVPGMLVLAIFGGVITLAIPSIGPVLALIFSFTFIVTFCIVFVYRTLFIRRKT